MKNVGYDAEKDSVNLEPGVRWGDAVSALESKGVAPVGGRVT
jgi:FAD/FMN-containing dehydrogenase